MATSSNLRYKHFKQNIFTAGDREQFEDFCCATPRKSKKIQRGVGVKYHPTLNFHPLFNNPTYLTVGNTFKYLFYKFKKGIFVQFRDGHLSVFLPFSNVHFTNEFWREVNTAQIKTSIKVHHPSRWYANDYLIRYENPCNENNHGYEEIKNMFEILSQTYAIPDVEFFINKRDFPVLKKDGTEPYKSAYGINRPLLSHSQDKYSLILGMVEHKDFADISIPTPEDWTRMSGFSGARTKRSQNPLGTGFCKDWNKKKPVAVFRGSNTGPRFGELRVKMCQMCLGDERFDAGITSESKREQIINGIVTSPPPIDQNIIRNFLSMEEQAGYKYIIHISGHVQAFRLSEELALCSVIILVECPYKLWFESKLEEWVHYIPAKGDLSDIKEKVSWCLANDHKCSQIALRARQFYDEHLSHSGSCLEHLNTIIQEYRNTCALEFYDYPTISEFEFQKREELELVKINSGKPIDSPIVSSDRCFLNILSLFEKNFSEIRINKSIFKSKNTHIQQLVTKKHIMKKSATSLVHEAAVGLLCTNEILRAIPNFCYTFSYNQQANTLYLEYIETFHGSGTHCTLFDYIKSQGFVFDEFIFILKQVCLALGVGQRMFFLTHHDVAPWNILLHRSVLKDYDYIVDKENVFRVQTSVIPVLCDFQRSFAICGDVVFKDREEFSLSKDAITLLLKCVDSLIFYKEVNLAQYQKNLLVELFNLFFENSETSEGYFEHLSNFNQLLLFLKESHKHAHICFSPKGKIETKSPLDLFNCLSLIFPSSDIIAVEYAEHNHMGKIFSIYKIPKDLGAHGVLQKYMAQQLWLTTRINVGTARRFLLQSTYNLTISNFDLDKGSEFGIANVFINLLKTGGDLKLKKEERVIILRALSNVKTLCAELLRVKDIWARKYFDVLSNDTLDFK